MTREQAIKIIAQAWRVDPFGGSVHLTVDGMTDALINLGILKLEEPQSAEEKLISLFINNVQNSAIAAQKFVAVIEAAGLQIVEK